jgi:hypothetical protein
MACYCPREVRYRGRLVSVTFRYGIFQDAKVKRGKPLPRLGRGWGYEDHRKVAVKATKAVLRILRRRGSVNDRGGLTACENCRG